MTFQSSGSILIKKSGIALVITIAFVAAIAALIGLSMGVLEKSFKRVADKHFLIQGDVLMSNMLGILRNVSGDVTDAMTLEIFLAVPYAFENKDFDASVSVSFESASTRPNINQIVSETNASRGSDANAPVPLNTAMEEYLDHILTVYNVSDKILLTSMIADAVDADDQERVVGSELAVEYPDFTQGRIYDIHHFEQILDAYELLTLDHAARNIPWEELIGFDNAGIDLNYITPGALQFLAPDLPVDSLALLTTERSDLYESLDDLPLLDETKERLKSLNVVFYSPEVSGDILIRSGALALQVAFLYNLETKEVSNIEITQ